MSKHDQKPDVGGLDGDDDAGRAPTARCQEGPSNLSPDMHRLILDQMESGFALHEIICDDRGMPCDYRFLSINPAFERLTGLRAEAIVGRTVREVVPGIETAWIERYGQVAVTGIPAEFEDYAAPLDRWFGVRAFCPKRGTFAVLFHDITARKQAEARLQDREQRYRVLYEGITDAVFVHEMFPDGMPGPFIEVNDVACARLGYTREEFLRMSPKDVDAPESGTDLPSIVPNLLSGGKVTFEQIHVARDGHRIPVEVSARIFELNGRRAVISLVRDISERKRLEEERRRLEHRMLQTQKSESLGLLAGGIAHDFNNLLVAVLGNVDLALADLPEGAPARRSLTEIERAARRAADLCRQLLAYSGKGRFVTEPVNVNAVATEMAHMLEVSVTKRALLRYDLALDLPLIEADATQLGQVIMNLILNASESIGDEIGVIVLATGAMDCDRAFLDSSLFHEDGPEGRYVCLEVRDSGCGMDGPTLKRVFDPFFTTKFMGRGLGLAAVLGIVRGHHGAIRVESEPGRGTTFRVLFPALPDGVGATPAPAAEALPLGGQGRILLVDDEESVRDVGKRLLEHLGFQVRLAADGREAVAVMSADPQAFDCALVDLTMPIQDGAQTVRELRRIRADLPAVLMSGYSEQEVEARFAGEPFSAFVQKPFDLAALSGALRRVIRRGA